MKFKLTLITLGIAMCASGCGPSESDQIATITQIAAGIFATQTAQAPTVTPTPIFSPGETRISPIDGMTMVYIPPGEYTLGSTQADVDWAMEACQEYFDDCDSSAFQDELPQHTVQLDPYWIDQTEITYGMFAQFVDETGYETEAERVQYSYVYQSDEWDRVRDADWADPDYYDPEGLRENPVVNISWYDAWAYCEWADRRLPTEAEWEAAARGSELRIFPWGDAEPGDTLANLADKSIPFTSWRNNEVNDGFYWTGPVMSYPDGASPFGVLGMAGNVKEWVYDWYSPAYDLPSPAVNPVNLVETEYRVHRGGSYATILTAARTASRAENSPNWKASDMGFRCAFSDLTLPDPPEQDTSLPDVKLVRYQEEIYITPGSYDKHGKLKSNKDLEITGQYNQCQYIRISTPDYPEGWLKIDDNIVLYKDCSEIEEIFIRPESGIWGKMYSGNGTLTVKNQGETDVYLVLLWSPTVKSRYSMYVRAGEQVTMENMLDGSYEVYLTTGTIWVSYEGRFKDVVSYEKLTEPMEFTSTETTASAWELVLETVEDGTQEVTLLTKANFHNHRSKFTGSI